MSQNDWVNAFWGIVSLAVSLLYLASTRPHIRGVGLASESRASPSRVRALQGSKERAPGARFVLALIVVVTGRTNEADGDRLSCCSRVIRVSSTTATLSWTNR